MSTEQPEAPPPASPVFLRALEPGDVERTWRWHNDPMLYGQLVSGFRYVSTEAERAWLAGRCAFSTKQVSLAICLHGTDQHVGNIYLNNIDWAAHNAELGIFIGEPARQSCGCGQAALRLLISHAFSDLGLQRLYLYVLPENHRAIHVYQKCGFEVEGKLRRHIFKHGMLRDLLVMGLCAPEQSDSAKRA